MKPTPVRRQPGAVPFGSRATGLAVELDRPLRWLVEETEEVEEGRLAAPGRPSTDTNSPGANREVDSIEGTNRSGAASVSLPDSRQPDRREAGPLSSQRLREWEPKGGTGREAARQYAEGDGPDGEFEESSRVEHGQRRNRGDFAAPVGLEDLDGDVPRHDPSRDPRGGQNGRPTNEASDDPNAGSPIARRIPIERRSASTRRRRTRVRKI